MKFEISITPRDGQKSQRQQIKGFITLEDACRTALALGPVHRHSSLVGVWLPAHKRAGNSTLLAIYIEDDERGANMFMEKARRVMVDTLANRKVSQTRMDWIKAKDTADNTFSVRLFATVPSPNDAREHLYVNQAAITAFFANDFATVEKLLAENLAPVNAGENKP